MFNGRRQPSNDGTSRMTRECQVRFCERLGVKFPGPTRRSRHSSSTRRQIARTYLVFADVEGKLDVLRVECARCQRKGRYSVRMLIEKYGRNANMMKWGRTVGRNRPVLSRQHRC
jgi:hypothetical protein